MVAWVVVVVRHGRVEDHSAEQLCTIGFGLVGPPPQVVGQQRVGPAIPVHMAIAAVEYGQAADQAEAQIATLGVLPIKTLQHQHVAVADRLQPRLGDVQTAPPGQIQRRKLDPLEIETVILGGELAEPQALPVFDRGLRPRAAHAGAGIELFEQIRGDVLAFLDGLRRGNQLIELMRSVVVTLGCRRLDLQPKAEISRPVLGAVEQVVDLLEIGGAAFQLVFDHAPAPGIGRRIAHCTGDTLELREFEHLLGQGQPERIECHRLGPRKIAIAVAESPDLDAVRQGLHAQQRRRNGLQAAGKLDVDVGLALRSHSRRQPCVACRLGWGAERLRAPCRANRHLDRRRRPASDPVPRPIAP